MMALYTQELTNQTNPLINLLNGGKDMLNTKSTNKKIVAEEKNDLKKVLKSFECSERCRVCPFPGAKCNRSKWN